MKNCLLFDTLAALARATILPGTTAVVVERFDATSARSSSRYIPVGDKPSHDLSAFNVGSNMWWAIHPDCLSLEAAGAPVDVSADCANAMARVLRYLLAARQATLQLRQRDYVLESCASLFQAGGDSPVTFTIAGSGRDASRLLVCGPKNRSGAIALTFADTRSEVVARGFSVVATGADGAGNDCGTGIRVVFSKSADAVPGTAYGVRITDLFVGGQGGAFFAEPVEIAGTSRPRISDCSFAVRGSDSRMRTPAASRTERLPQECSL